MVDTFKKLDQRQVPATATTLYTVPAATETLLRHIRVTNPTGIDRWIKLWHDGVTDPFLILPEVVIVAGGWAEFDGMILMEAADTLSGQAEVATALTVTLYGDEVS